jgi:Tfp pilus assembly protein PilE
MSRSRKVDAPHSLPGPRAGSLLIEATVALAIIAIVAAIVAQSIVWSLEERARAASHQAANELAANVLEAARALPFEKLDQHWADAQVVPSEMAALLPGGTVVVTVETGPAMSKTKRVTVEVRWLLMPDHPPQSVRLTTLLSGRETKKIGGTP